MKKKFIRYGTFLAALSAVFLLLAFLGKGTRKVTTPTLSYVKRFVFINQDSKPFTERDMRGKVCVINYFFTSCKGICPRMNNNMQKVYDEFKEDAAFMIISHTCDPETDSATVLKHYADSLKINTARWVFLTGRKDSLYLQARNSYLLDDPKNGLVDISDQFLHTSFFALVDKNGRVRGQLYDGLKEDQMIKLKNDIKELLNEPMD